MFNTLLRNVVRQGTLTIISSSGRRRDYGRGEPHVIVRFHDRLVAIELAMRPEMKLGELYMDRRITVEAGGNIADLLDLLIANLNQRYRTFFPLRFRFAFGFLTRRWRQFNSASGSKAHARHRRGSTVEGLFVRARIVADIYGEDPLLEG